MNIDIRTLVKELLEDENLIVSYNELNDGGFDLSVRINEEVLNRVEEKIDVSYDKGVVDYLKKASGKYIPTHCPHCGSKNVQSMYGTINLDGSGQLTHYICKDCQKEFEV